LSKNHVKLFLFYLKDVCITLNMDTVFLIENANQRVVDDTTVLNKRIDHLLNHSEKGLYMKDNNYRPTQEFVYYFPSSAIQSMSQRNIIKKWVYMILYTQEKGSVIDRFEDPIILNDHDADRIKSHSKEEKKFYRKYKQFRIYGLYAFDKDDDAKIFFRK